MTVSSENNRNAYVATGGQTLFTYSFRILDKTHIAVYQNGTKLTLTTNYTVQNVGASAGGTITLVTGATANDTITLLRDVPFTQETDYVENDTFPAQTHEDTVDKVVMAVQELSERADRAISVSEDSTKTNLTIPDPEALKYIRWNTGATALENVSILGQAKTNETSTAPGVTDDAASGYSVGSRWYDTTADKEYVCLDSTNGAAVWTETTAGAAAGDSWGDVVDADIIPDADGTRDLGATATRFAETYTDALDVTNNITVGGTVDGRDVATDGTKLDGIESGATADQTGAEIKTAYEGEADTNAFTDAEQTKLSGIEASADVTDETNVTAAFPISDATTLVKDPVDATKLVRIDAGSITTGNTRVLTMADVNVNLGTNQTKLDGIESGATADQTGAEIKTAYEGEADTNAFTDAEQTKLAGIETAADVTDETNVTAAFPISDATTLVKDPVDATKLVRIDAGSITTGNTRVLTMADVDVNLGTNQTKLDGIETGADVTDTANVTAAGALMDSEVDADIKTLALPANTTISAFGATLVDDATAAAARTTLDVDQAGTDNSTDVTLAGTPDYITIAGQVITRNSVDLDTDVTGTLPTANIDDEAITLAKMQHIATASILGRETAATGDVEVLSAEQVRGIIGQPIIQMVYSETSSKTTSSTIVPADDTIPQQSSDGATTGLSVTITPTKTTNRLIIGWNCMVSANTAGAAIVSPLYQDSTEDALTARGTISTAVNDISSISGLHEMQAGTVSSTTFKLFFGPHVSATVTTNGVSSTRLYSTIPKSSMWVYEIDEG